MALPTIQKTWQYDVNNQVDKLGTETLTAANMILTIKNIMTGFASSPWTVAGSSNQTTAGMDGVDRWSTTADFRWGASGNISWIVLEQSGIDGYFQLLLSMNTASTYNINCSFSPTGVFTGGSITAPPTAIDAVTVKSASAWGGQNGTSHSSIKIHVMQSTDGECTRIFIYKVSYASTQELQIPFLCGIWIFDKVREPSVGWNYPYFCSIIATSASAAGVGVLSDFTSLLVGFHNSLTVALSYTWEGTLDGTPFSTLLTSANKVDQTEYIFPIGIASVTVGARGRHGTIWDMWWGNSYLADGNTFSDGLGNDDFIKIGCFILPWPSSTEMLKA